MTGNRYKAFISYSHRDESWASWLHKSLESYKVPRRLVGKTGESGVIPAKLYPVFRDRDELSSGADLSEKVQTALEMSDALVVVCSPSSVKSRWVNEEIRKFRSLGRENRIFCVIVDGDPQAKNLDEACFPPALLESGVGEHVEPLAADARKWADGKVLARLKLVSGILGIRLDELRQRDQQRKRKIQLAYALAVVAALVLIGMTVISKVRESARREQAENLVTQIVEISEGLNSVVDLETLQGIGERLQSYLESLDPGDLTPESNKQIAMVLRQLGEVSRLQGKPDAALEALLESREVIRQLVERVPGNNDYLFELGNAEFYVGNILTQQGEYESAGQAFQSYKDVAEELVIREPDNPDWIMELSYSHTNLAGFQKLSGTGNVTAAQRHMDSAINLVESAMNLAPDNGDYRAHYATILAWGADTSLLVCDLDGALDARRKSVQAASDALGRQPSDNNLKEQYANALTGVAVVQRQVGMIEESLQNLSTAREMLSELSLFDRENLDYQWGTVRLDGLIFDLMAESGEVEAAIMLAAAPEEAMREILQSNALEQSTWYSQYAQYLLDYSSLLWRSGNHDAARLKLDKAIEQLTIVLSASEEDQGSRERLGKARFIAWEQSGSDVLGGRPELAAFLQQKEEDRLSCSGADVAVRNSIIEGNQSDAQERVNYLRNQGYSEPGFVRFCERYELCGQQD